MEGNNKSHGDNRTYGFYKPDPGNGLNPMEILRKERTNWEFVGPEKMGGMILDLDPADFMTVNEMESSTIDLVRDPSCEHKTRMLEDRVRSMCSMQRYLLGKLAKLTAHGTTVLVEMHGSAIYEVRSSSPARVVLLDADTESSDRERIRTIGGEEVYVHDYKITDSTPQLDPLAVEAVVKAVTEAFATKCP